MKEIVAKDVNLGNRLLKDPRGNKVLAISKSKNGDTDDIAHEIFREWLATDVKASWNELIGHLNSVGLPDVAKIIDDNLGESTIIIDLCF